MITGASLFTESGALLFTDYNLIQLKNFLDIIQRI